ncbi:MAG: metallophosphoesterase [Ignavibacteriae bacterium]|nr:metallophosphoesterase [Ignavibacteriota bacterium]
MIKNKKIAVIGDIHGCFDELQDLYEKIFAFTDEVYSVGDLIDRGPDSRQVIQFCIDNNIKPVKGNHEDLLIKAIENQDSKKGLYSAGNSSLGLWDGAEDTVESYTGTTRAGFKIFTDFFKDSGHFEYISGLPLEIELGDCIISHGGIIKEQKPESCLWNREEPAKLDVIQVIGHTPHRGVIHKQKHYINVDTGCVFWGTLSAVVLSEDNVEILSSN